MTARDVDKYHKRVKDENKHLNPLFDIKEVPKRAYQLGLAALFLGVALAVYDATIGLYVSSFLLGCFCFAIMMFMFLKHNGDINNLTIGIISLVCGMLIDSVILEGLDSEQYLYFFPILIAVPVIVNLKQTRYRQSATYIAIILFSFTATTVIGHYATPQESYNHQQIEHLAFVNRILAIFSTIVFALAYIFFEEKYIIELTKQSKNVIESRTRFLATMGHELRTPLNGIIGVINLLKQDHTVKEHEEYLQVLKYCSDHMLQQVNNILDFNKIEADKLEIHPVPLNLTQLLLNVSMPLIALIQEKGLSFKIDIDPRLDILVMADDLRLIQVFNNLFSNALKFTQKGYVKLKAELISDDTKYATVNFTIEDTGVGVSEEDKQLIFNGFWQVQDKNTKSLNGTGLGLTICVRLLTLMNGQLNLVSEKGSGSKFNFQLQLEHTGQNFSNTASGSEDNLNGINILLAEDNPINMMVADKVLTGHGATVTGAYDGRETLKLLNENTAFDVILLDLEMPVMSGYEAIFEIKKLYPHIPVLAFTASLVDENMLVDLYASGFDDCILKPFQPHQLLSTIKKHLSAFSVPAGF